jgi:hypothetical protein
MRRVEGVSDMAEESQRAGCVERPLMHERREIRAGNQAHRQVEAVLRLTRLVDRHHTLVFKRRLQLPLAPEASYELGIGAQIAGSSFSATRRPSSTCWAP